MGQYSRNYLISFSIWGHPPHINHILVYHSDGVGCAAVLPVLISDTVVWWLAMHRLLLRGAWWLNTKRGTGDYNDRV
jgi:hypothetical protein